MSRAQTRAGSQFAHLAPVRLPRPGGGLAAPHMQTYWNLSTRPLHMLTFLLPLMFLYEVGTLVFLSSRGTVEVVRARLLLGNLFSFAGSGAFHLPPLLLVIVLVTWHVLTREKVHIQPRVAVGMAAESFLWTLPLIVLAAVAGVSTVFAEPSLARLPHGTPSGHALPVALDALSVPAKLTLSLGAGIYEELLFRLVLLGAVHMVLVDFFKQPGSVGYVVGAVLSAVAFTFYHNVRVGAGVGDLRRMFIYSVAGVYFSALFIIRGFGVAAGTHAAYDCVALLLLTGDRG